MEVLRHQGFELPTEAQWEYAARCAKTKTEATGNLSGTSDGWSKTALVGRFAPNGFGLFDTCGNVAEWCRDGLGTYSKAFRAGDGLRGSAKESAMVRGGSWSSTAPEARATHRRSFLCDKSSDQIGVRPVRKIYD
jgi:formylglycine-generating enzyme required for sulfatase activity